MARIVITSLGPGRVRKFIIDDQKLTVVLEDALNPVREFTYNMIEAILIDRHYQLSVQCLGECYLFKIDKDSADHITAMKALLERTQSQQA